MESSTEQYPTILVVSLEMQHLKAAPCPDFLRQCSNGVLTMDHMDVAVPFTCPRPWGGEFRGSDQVYPP